MTKKKPRPNALYLVSKERSGRYGKKYYKIQRTWRAGRRRNLLITSPIEGEAKKCPTGKQKNLSKRER